VGHGDVRVKALEIMPLSHTVRRNRKHSSSSYDLSCSSISPIYLIPELAGIDFCVLPYTHQ